MEIVKINDKISYIKAVEEPILSSDVGIVRTKNNTYIYDVGALVEVSDYLNKIQGNKILILSHFHKDHTSVLNKVMDISKIYQGKETYKHTKIGEPMLEDVTIEDDDTIIEIKHLRSSHSKDSLIMIVDREYAFVGDAIYPPSEDGSKGYNVGILKEQIEQIEALDTKYMLLGHDKRFVYPKSVLEKFLKGVYKKREKGNPYIKGMFK